MSYCRCTCACRCGTCYDYTALSHAQGWDVGATSLPSCTHPLLPSPITSTSPSPLYEVQHACTQVRPPLNTASSAGTPCGHAGTLQRILHPVLPPPLQQHLHTQSQNTPLANTYLCNPCNFPHPPGPCTRSACGPLSLMALRIALSAGSLPACGRLPVHLASQPGPHLPTRPTHFQSKSDVQTHSLATPAIPSTTQGPCTRSACVLLNLMVLHTVSLVATLRTCVHLASHPLPPLQQHLHTQAKSEPALAITPDHPTPVIPSIPQAPCMRSACVRPSLMDLHIVSSAGT